MAWHETPRARGPILLGTRMCQGIALPVLQQAQAQLWCTALSVLRGASLPFSKLHERLLLLLLVWSYGNLDSPVVVVGAHGIGEN